MEKGLSLVITNLASVDGSTQGKPCLEGYAENCSLRQLEVLDWEHGLGVQIPILP